MKPGKGNSFMFVHNIQTGTGCHPVSPSMYRGSFPEIKRQGREVSHTRPMPRVRLNAAYGGGQLCCFCDSTRDLTPVVSWVVTSLRNPLPSFYALKMEAADSSRRWYLFIKLHGVSSRKAEILALMSSNLASRNIAH